jgi:vacuolar-type H+-ATPase subunit I/STV1
MQHSTPTGSVSDRHGWEWNRLQTGTESGGRAPDRPASGRNPQQRIEQLEREVARLRTELQHRERQQAEIIQQYERHLAEKNRQLADGKQDAETILDAVVDQIR